MDYSLPGSSVHGILQARTLEWVTMPSSRGSSQPGDRTWVSLMVGRFFTIWATREAWRKPNQGGYRGSAGRAAALTSGQRRWISPSKTGGRQGVADQREEQPLRRQRGLPGMCVLSSKGLSSGSTPRERQVRSLRPEVGKCPVCGYRAPRPESPPWGGSCRSRASVKQACCLPSARFPYLKLEIDLNSRTKKMHALSAKDASRARTAFRHNQALLSHKILGVSISLTYWVGQKILESLNGLFGQPSNSPKKKKKKMVYPIQ